MVYCDIDVNQTSTSRACVICHCCYFLDEGFTFQLAVCNGYRDLLMMSIDLNIIAILNITVLIIILLLMELVKVKLYII